jgi:hypothetical protein
VLRSLVTRHGSMAILCTAETWREKGVGLIYFRAMRVDPNTLLLLRLLVLLTSVSRAQ